MSPVFGEIAMLVGRLNGLPLHFSASCPSMPIVTTSSPSGVYFLMQCWLSFTVQMKSSGLA